MLETTGPLHALTMFCDIYIGINIYIYIYLRWTQCIRELYAVFYLQIEIRLETQLKLIS